MDTLLKRGLRYIPGLQDGVRQARQRLHTSRLHRVEAQVSQSAGYEILVVFGMRRSGNHLAINWILEQVDGAAVFYNNIKPVLVFDGRNLPSKASTEAKRRENRAKYRKMAKDYLVAGKFREARECFQRCIDITPQMEFV